MKRNLTPEQQTAAQERRAAMRKLAKQISGMSPEDRNALAARMPVVTIEGRALSVFNSCMIAMQRPDATVVGGFRQWINASRAVKKGEHGLALWVPMKIDKPEGTEGEPDELHFLLGTVFDVTQTQEVETAQAS